MKWLPVKNNIEWTPVYDDVPHFVDKNIDKTDWMLQHYCNTDKTIWDEVPLTKSTVKTTNTDAVLRIGLTMLRKLTPYANWTLDDLLKVNYVFSDNGDFYFVATTNVINGNSVEFTMIRDLWMSKIDNVIVQDEIPRKVLRGHYNRFTDIDDNTKTINTDLDNPNWKNNSLKEYMKVAKSISVYTSKFTTCELQNQAGGSNFLWNAKNVSCSGSNKTDLKYKFLNEFYWLTIFVNLDRSLADDPASLSASYGDGTKVITNGGEVVLPYRIYSLPILSTDLYTAFKIKNYDTSSAVSDIDVVDMLDGLTKSSSKVIGATLTKGLFYGSTLFSEKSNAFNVIYKNTPLGETIELWLNNSDIVYTSQLDEFGLVVGTSRAGSPIVAPEKIDLTDRQVNTEILSILKGQNNSFFPFVSNELRDKFADVFRIPEIRDFFNKRFNNSDLSETNKKDIKLEPLYYSNQISELILNTPTVTKKLSYQYLEGKYPDIKKKSFMDNGTVTEKTLIIGNKYLKMSLNDAEILENKNNIFPTRTVAYNDYLIQNQSQRAGNLARIGAEGGTNILKNLFNPFSLISSATDIGTEVMQIKNKESDIMREPHQIKNLSGSIVNDFLVDNNELIDYLVLSQVSDVDMNEIWNDVYRKGCYWNFEKVINFSSRYWFNYWMIEDINKTLDVSNLHNDEIELVRSIFTSGIRLWNIRSLSQKLNMKIYDLENLEYGRQ